MYTVSKTGGHLSSSLGVVELAVAIHHVFDAPDDKIIWDVGHQVWMGELFIFFLISDCCVDSHSLSKKDSFFAGISA